MELGLNDVVMTEMGDGGIYLWIRGREGMDGRTDGPTDGRSEGRMERRTQGRKNGISKRGLEGGEVKQEGQTDGRMDRGIEIGYCVDRVK